MHRQSLRPWHAAIAVAFALSITLSPFAAHANLFQRAPKQAKPRIGVIQVDGVISDGTATGVKSAIKQVKKDPRIAGVLLKVNSPGGGVGPMQEITQHLASLKATGKPIAGASSSIATSAGYALLLPAGRIFVLPGTITGSIGVIMQRWKLKGLLDILQISQDNIVSGNHKAALQPTTDFEDHQRASLQAVVDDMAGQFMQAVSEARNLELSRVQQLATGEVFSGRQAMEHGLVDELTGEEGATNWLAEQLHVEPDALELVTLTKSPGIWSRFSPGGTGALLNSLLGLSPTLPMAIYPHHGPRGH